MIKTTSKRKGVTHFKAMYGRRSGNNITNRVN